MGIAYAKWMEPNNIINGGVTSLAMILNKVSNVPLPYLTNIITVFLLLMCYLFLGKKNLYRSIVSSVCYNFFFSLFYLSPINIQISVFWDLLLASFFIAFGYYCCISTDASTVGMDVIALIMNKKFGYSIVSLLRLVNLFILMLGFWVYGLESVIVGIIFSLVNTFILDRMLKKNSYIKIQSRH